MIRKSIVYLGLFVFISSCEKNKNYVAEFSYSVNGESFTSKGGGILYAEGFSNDSVKYVSYRTSLYADPNNNGKLIMRDTTLYYDFALYDYTGGKKRHFDMQNLDEVYPFFKLDYKGNLYWAISGFIELKKAGKKGSELQGYFEAVMVYPLFYPTDTIVVKNGSFYYSQVF